MPHNEKKDFYLNDQGLAACFEKDWIDHAIVPESGRSLFEFAPFDTGLLQTRYHEQLMHLIARAARETGRPPVSYFEVGAALGRTFFEACRNFESLRTATLVEPSSLLSNGFRKIFAGEEVERFAMIKGFCQTEIAIRTAPIRNACRRVKIAQLPMDFQTLAPAQETYDLAVCSNVIDQCHGPHALAKLVQDATARGGLIAMTCTYQWQTKFVGNTGRQIADIKDLFGQEWRLMAEANHPFQARVNERYWKHFLSHAVVYQKI